MLGGTSDGGESLEVISVQFIHFNPEFITNFASSFKQDESNGHKKARKKRRTQSLELKIDDLHYSEINEYYNTSLKADYEEDACYGDEENWVEIAKRNVLLAGSSPSMLLDIVARSDGFREVRKGIFEMKSSGCKVIYESQDGLFEIRSKGNNRVKPHTLMTLIFDADDSDELVVKLKRSLKAELTVLNMLFSKTNPDMFSMVGPEVNFTLNTITNEVELGIHYIIKLRCGTNHRFPPESRNKINNIVRNKAKPFPTINDRFTSRIDRHEPINPQLFYNIISEHTFSLSNVETDFDIPELETNLLRFQRKTVKWLLEKEGVKYDTSSSRCITKPLIQQEFLELISKNFNLEPVDDEKLESMTFDFLNQLCFGWRRIKINGTAFWFNKYTGNICTRNYAYQFILDYDKETDKEIAPVTLPAKGLLAEEMGLGKTVEVTSLILMNQRPVLDINEPIQIQLQLLGDLKTVVKSKTTLIIAPDSILKQWVDEIVNLAPSLAITIYKGVDKYQLLNNNAGLIAEYLKKFDVVFTTYSVISKELDYALYSSRNKPTRNSKKRKTSYEDPSNQNEVDEVSDGDTSFGATVHQDNKNDIRTLVKKYKAYFQLSLAVEKPRIANQKSDSNQAVTDYEKALQEEILLAVKHNKIPNIYGSHEYQSPLMLIQFWRVVLDEVQMVSSRLSRAFQSAALIPRFHAWGVSGTPIKKEFSDLHSILKFLKFQPFTGAESKYSWALLTTLNQDNLNEDFIRLWTRVGLRHTKALVHDDIKLPPQDRILMTIPFTPVEQENYNDLFETCLATICLDSDGNPVLSDWEPSQMIFTYMRQWLVKLRQVCCNPQIGKLSISCKKAKSKNYGNNHRILAVAQHLKTLEHVLDDMLDKAYNQILNSEVTVVQVYAEIAQFLEFTLMPKESLEVLKLGCFELEQILLRLTLTVDRCKKEYQNYRSQHNLKPINTEDEEFDDNFEIDESETSSIRIKETLNRFQDQIKSTNMKIRSYMITLHKFYFLIASCHFQCYDEEYGKKIAELSIKDKIQLGSLSSVKRLQLNVRAITLLVSGISMEVLESEGFSETGRPKIENRVRKEEEEEGQQGLIQDKFYEQIYYNAAEELRSNILQSSIKSVHKAVESKIASRSWYTPKNTKFYDQGLSLLPKSSKKLFASLPSIDLSNIKKNVLGVKLMVFFEKLTRLADQLNIQCEYINELMTNLLDILSKPLIGYDKNPDGEEYEKSIEDQDKASCYLYVISQLLMDRNEFVAGAENSAKISVIKVNEEKKLMENEMNKVHHTEFLDLLQQRRSQVKPKMKYSLQESILDLKNVELDLRDELSNSDSKKVEVEVFEQTSHYIRTIFENQKLSQILFQRELNSSCNSVFNTRIEYFKQLQQISDSVKPPEFSFTQTKLNAKLVMKELDTYYKKVSSIHASLGKSISKFRYLQTLVRKDESTGSVDEEELMCIICRSTITIGALTQCGHKYCKECLELWLRTQRTCPMCKNPVSESTVYNFTHHKPDLKANKIQSAGSDPKKSNMFSIYHAMDESALREIQGIQLKNLYSSKVDLIVRQVLYLKSKDPAVQIVIFSQWQDLLYILGTAFKSANISFLGSHGTLTPEVGGGRRRNKYDSVEEFKDKRNGITCFLLNAKAQASGLTLVNATHIFLCEPLVNTSLELQAISRIHRIGQTQRTTVWMFAIENTVEESIVLMSTNKRLQYFETGNGNGSFKQEGGLPSTTNKTQELMSTSKERNLSKAESLTMMKSGGIDTLINKGNGEGETVTNNDLWSAFFSAKGFNQPLAPSKGPLK